MGNEICVPVFSASEEALLVHPHARAATEMIFIVPSGPLTPALRPENPAKKRSE